MQVMQCLAYLAGKVAGHVWHWNKSGLFRGIDVSPKEQLETPKLTPLVAMQRTRAAATLSSMCER